MTMPPEVAILDLGGQYCHLISRRLRDLRIRAAILPPDIQPDALKGYAGIILSGGPRSVYERDAPTINPGLLDLDKPILGICYGHQLLAKQLGGAVEPGAGEYGLSELTLLCSDTIFRDTPREQAVWMSHSDSVSSVPGNLVRLAMTSRCQIAAFADFDRRMYGVQFHPEVTHSKHGLEILKNFCVDVCGAIPERSAVSRVPALEEEIREKVGDRSVFFLVSGGVDSSVAFALCAEALPAERVLGLYVDTGLMRKGETEELQENFSRLGLAQRLKVRDESQRFLKALQGTVDPEKKREIIGRLFVEVQAEAIKEYVSDDSRWLLGQGTIYPDTIESGGGHGRAAVIKTHHNRCAEINELMSRGLVIEPLVDFYKDEVREIGREVGLNAALTNRWPFPGPGLAIRCLCCEDGTAEAEIINLEEEFIGFEAARLPLRSVGVQGDGRTYRSAVAVRGPLDYDCLQRLSGNLCNLNTAYNRVILMLNREDVEPARLHTHPAFLSEERIALLREADYVVREVMKETGLTDSVWQFPVVMIPVSYNSSGETIVLRPVNSVDGMTANFAQLPLDVLQMMTKEISAIQGIDLVCLDVTDKPPATIEWE